MIPPGAREEYFALDGGQVRILRQSAATPPGRTPLLLIHGGGTDNAAISWYELFATLGTEHPLVALDLPGFGSTQGIAPLGGGPELAGFVDRVMAGIGLDQAVVMGVSMGGDAALNLALRHPARVTALILIGPGGLVPIFGNRGLQLAAWFASRLPDPMLSGLGGLANRFVDQALRAMVSDIDALPVPVRTEFAASARRPGAAMGYVRYNQASLGPQSMRNNLLPVVSRIAVPTLFFHGADDPIVPPAGSIKAFRQMPAAQLVLVAGCGHWAQLEAPEEFRAAVIRFLSTLAEY